MWIVRLALRRPYTFVVVAILILIMGAPAILRTPTDIFPNIDIPVVSIIWSFTGLLPEDMADRIISVTERNHTTTVDNRNVDIRKNIGWGAKDCERPHDEDED